MRSLDMIEPLDKTPDFKSPACYVPSSNTTERRICRLDHMLFSNGAPKTKEFTETTMACCILHYLSKLGATVQTVHRFEFSDTADRNLIKLDRKQVLKIFDQVCVFLAYLSLSTKMAALISD